MTIGTQLAIACPTCGRAATNPTRTVYESRIVSGCVDEYHTDHVWDSWHFRKEAKQIRKDNARFFGVIWKPLDSANRGDAISRGYDHNCENPTSHTLESV